MINILHLLWIIPAAACFGYVMAALLTVASAADDWEEYNGSD